MPGSDGEGDEVLREGSEVAELRAITLLWGLIGFSDCCRPCETIASLSRVDVAIS